MSETARNVRQRNGSKHDKTGCLTCRERRKKCIPNTFPVCGACKRLNLECVREPARQVLRTSRASLTQTLPQGLWHDWLPPDAHGRDEPTRRRHAMKFYISVLSPLLTVSAQYSSFVSEFLPMAMDSAAFAHALVAWSSDHLSSIDNSYRVTALEARSAALRLLQSSIHFDDTACRETNAATSLVLMTSEVCMGDFSKWYHLIGVKNMILSSQSRVGVGRDALCGPDALKQTPEGRWILRNFAYHDILGSVTLGKRPLIKACYLHDITDVVDTYIGVATEILAVISEISSFEPLSLAYQYISSDDAERTGIANTFRIIEKRLQDWTCLAGTISTLEALAYTYRSSVLIYLYRRTYRTLVLLDDPLPCPSNERNCTALGSKIQKEVAIALQHIANVPLKGTPESALLFPLFLAGAETVDRSHIDMIRLRLRILFEKRPFQNILRAWKVLEETWAQRQDSQKDVDWQEIVDQQDGLLLLT